MGIELLKDNKFWLINTCNYSKEYKKYFEENRVVMGLGDDLDLKKFINSDKGLKHKFDDYLKKFLKIKRGDYIYWILLDRVSENGNSYLEINQVLGKVTEKLCDGYELIKEVGHSLPIQVIESHTSTRLGVDEIELYEIENFNGDFSDFKELEGINELANKEVIKRYVRFYYFGLENIEHKNNELKIKFKYFKNEKDKRDVLDKLRLIKKGYYVLGEFISKNDEKKEVFRVIGIVKDINLEEKLELVLEIKDKKKIGYNYGSLIDFYNLGESEKNINFINNKLRKNKNTILYGPPGTGKTYSIAEEILKIINPFMIFSEKANREDINKEIKKLQKDNRIKFCTFHQSYGYEEFVEGLRSDGKGNFVVEDGILKEIAIEAMFSALVYECKTEILNEKDNLDEKELKEKKKEAVLRYINEGNRFDFFNADQYTIVIDEINRGNISKIFGELITLLEEDKRLSKENEMIIKLPYSKEEFTLPPNLHLIGTMNTSDKSIAPIDIALRRRFKFIEVMPNEEILTSVDGIELDKMLKKINDRIEYLYDRDHMIGHAYFVNLNSLEDIISTFKDKIIPLLQEYFYEDWYKIGLVLGGIGQSNSDKYIIYKKEISPESLFNGTLGEDLPTVNKYYIKDEIGSVEIRNIYE